MRTLSAAVVTLAGVVLGGLETAAYAATTTYVTNQASASGFPVGSPIYDSATLGMGANPAGTITFRLYPPSNPTCVGTPLFTTSTAVSGNGYYESNWYYPTLAGTYRWTATYNGDANNSPDSSLCSDQGAVVDVAKRRATLLGSASVSGGGSVTTDTVTLTGASPTGTLHYKLFGPNNMTCAGVPARASSRTVSGSGSYTSASYTATVSGEYRWTAYYTGDVNNLAASSTCSDPSHAVDLVVGPSIGATPSSVPDGAVLTASWSGVASPTSTDWVALYAAGAPDSAIIAWHYTSGMANGSVPLTVPLGTPAGTYQLRLFSQNSYFAPGHVRRRHGDVTCQPFQGVGQARAPTCTARIPSPITNRPPSPYSR